MAPWLNKILSFALVIGAFYCPAQTQSGETRNDKDYKDPKQHEKFYKRRNIISAWQINQLKNGALVVRLKTNQMAIDELYKAGNTEMAKQKEAESYVINKNTITAFKDKFDFCKVYFIYSHHSDTLLNGARSGIFVDTALRVNPSITMPESFYLLAERDYGYNSSIGFLPEDSARGILEAGNPVKQMAFVIKNKYGHQLKNPFPYYVSEKTYVDNGLDYPVMFTKDQAGKSKISYTVDKSFSDSFEKSGNGTRPTRPQGNFMVKIPKQFTYEKLALAVDELDSELRRFFQSTPEPRESEALSDAKPFLY